MTAQAGRLSVTGALLAALIVWACCSRSKHTQEPNKPASHAEITGPATVKANAERLPGTVVTPHLECEITPGKNVLWCATFQIAWNEACDLLRGPIQWNGAPEMVRVLNKRVVTRRDLDEASYVAMAGYTTGDSNDIRQKIARELDHKFKNAANPELLHLLDPLPPGLWAAYAYLFKEMPFQWAFDRMQRGLVFAGREVESFGMIQFLRYQENEAKAASQVFVYDRRSEDDLIVELKTWSASDRLILAKIPPRRTLGETVALLRSRLIQSTPDSMRECSDLRIPIIDFDVLCDYRESLGGRLAVAAQQTRFRLDERGAVLKSEGGFAAARVDTDLIFDKPFLVMIQRTDARQPYFALWVGNAELLVPFHETSSKTSSSVR